MVIPTPPILKIKNKFMEKQINEVVNNQIENLWRDFKKYFWILFVIKVVFTYGVAKSESWTNFIFYTLNLEDAHLIIINLILQMAPIFLMVYIMGYFSYKISGDKKKIWKGLWGFLWFGVIAIFIGYFAVKRERDAKLQKT